MLVNLIRDDEQVELLCDVGCRFKLGLRHYLTARVCRRADDDRLEREFGAAHQLFASRKQRILFKRQVLVQLKRLGLAAKFLEDPPVIWIVRFKNKRRLAAKISL